MTRAKAEPLDEVAAVREAEQFISRNGYTDVWPSGTRLVYESIEMMAGGEELIEFRHDTLESKTYGIARRRKSRGPGWTVVFRYKHLPNRATGRAVTMDPDGEKVRVEHVDFFLDKVEKVLQK